MRPTLDTQVILAFRILVGFLWRFCGDKKDHRISQSYPLRESNGGSDKQIITLVSKNGSKRGLNLGTRHQC